MIERHSSIEPVHLGEILRQDILPALSVSKTAIAAALGVSRQTLYDILNDSRSAFCGNNFRTCSPTKSRPGLAWNGLNPYWIPRPTSRRISHHE